VLVPDVSFFLSRTGLLKTFAKEHWHMAIPSLVLAKLLMLSRSNKEDSKAASEALDEVQKLVKEHKKHVKVITEEGTDIVEDIIVNGPKSETSETLHDTDDVVIGITRSESNLAAQDAGKPGFVKKTVILVTDEKTLSKALGRGVVAKTVAGLEKLVLSDLRFGTISI